jgi:hypothetical protein
MGNRGKVKFRKFHLRVRQDLIGRPLLDYLTHIHNSYPRAQQSDDINGKTYAAADSHSATSRLAELDRRAECVWNDKNIMLLLTAGNTYSVIEIEASPIQLNRNIGDHTDFVNLLDLTGDDDKG